MTARRRMAVSLIEVIIVFVVIAILIAAFVSGFTIVLRNSHATSAYMQMASNMMLLYDEDMNEDSRIDHVYTGLMVFENDSDRYYTLPVEKGQLTAEKLTWKDEQRLNGHFFEEVYGGFNPYWYDNSGDPNIPVYDRKYTHEGYYEKSEPTVLKPYTSDLDFSFLPGNITFYATEITTFTVTNNYTGATVTHNGAEVIGIREFTADTAITLDFEVDEYYEFVTGDPITVEVDIGTTTSLSIPNIGETDTEGGLTLTRVDEDTLKLTIDASAAKGNVTITGQAKRQTVQMTVTYEFDRGDASWFAVPANYAEKVVSEEKGQRIEDLKATYVDPVIGGTIPASDGTTINVTYEGMDVTLREGHTITDYSYDYISGSDVTSQIKIVVKLNAVRNSVNVTINGSHIELDDGTVINGTHTEPSSSGNSTIIYPENGGYEAPESIIVNGTPVEAGDEKVDVGGGNIVSYLPYDKDGDGETDGYELIYDRLETPITVTATATAKIYEIAIVQVGGNNNQDCFLNTEEAVDKGDLTYNRYKVISDLTYDGSNYTFYINGTDDAHIDVIFNDLRIENKVIPSSAYTKEHINNSWKITLNTSSIFTNPDLVPITLHDVVIGVNVSQTFATYEVTFDLDGLNLYKGRMQTSELVGTGTFTISVKYNEPVTYYINGTDATKYAPDELIAVFGTSYTVLENDNTDVNGISFYSDNTSDAWGTIEFNRLAGNCTISAVARDKSYSVILNDSDRVVVTGTDGAVTHLGTSNDCVLLDGEKILTFSSAEQLRFDLTKDTDSVPVLQYANINRVKATLDGATFGTIANTGNRYTVSGMDLESLFDYDRIPAAKTVVVSVEVSPILYTVKISPESGLKILSAKDITASVSGTSFSISYFDDPITYYVNGTDAGTYAASATLKAQDGSSGINGVSHRTDGAYQVFTIDGLTEGGTITVTAEQKTVQLVLDDTSVIKSDLNASVGTTSDMLSVYGGNYNAAHADSNSITVSSKTPYTFTIAKQASEMDIYALTGITANVNEILTETAKDADISGRYYTYRVDLTDKLDAIFDYDAIAGEPIVLTANTFKTLEFEISVYLPEHLQVVEAASYTTAPNTSNGAYARTANTDSNKTQFPYVTRIKLLAGKTLTIYVNGTTDAYYATGSTGIGTHSTQGAYRRITISNLMSDGTIQVTEAVKRYTATLDTSSTLTPVSATADKCITLSASSFTYGARTSVALSVSKNTAKTATMNYVNLAGFSVIAGGSNIASTTSASVNFNELSNVSRIFDYGTISGSITVKMNNFTPISYKVTFNGLTNLKVMTTRSNGTALNSGTSYSVTVNYWSDPLTYYVNGTNAAYYADSTSTSGGGVSVTKDSAYQKVVLDNVTADKSLSFTAIAKSYTVSLDSATSLSPVNATTARTIYINNASSLSYTYNGGNIDIDITKNTNKYNGTETLVHANLKGFEVYANGTKILDTTSNSATLKVPNYIANIFNYNTTSGAITVKAKPFEKITYTVTVNMTGLWVTGATVTTNASGGTGKATNQTTSYMNISNKATLTLSATYFDAATYSYTAHSMFGYVTNGTTKGSYVTLGSASQSYKYFTSAYTYYDNIPITIKWSAGNITGNTSTTISAVAQYRPDFFYQGLTGGSAATIIPRYWNSTVEQEVRGKFNGRTMGVVKFAEGITKSIDGYSFITAVDSIYLADSMSSFGNYAFTGTNKVDHIYLGNSFKEFAFYTFHQCGAKTTLHYGNSTVLGSNSASRKYYMYAYFDEWGNLLSTPREYSSTLNNSKFLSPNNIGSVVHTGANANSVIGGKPCIEVTNRNGGVPCFLEYGSNGSNNDYKIIDPIASADYNASYTTNGVSTWSTSKVTY